MDKKILDTLIEKALEMRSYSYTPYSNYAVGACLLTDDDKLYTGCNIENATFTPTVCAERTAFFKAVSEGKKSFKAIAVTGGIAGKDPTDYAYPCGVCRQVMKEFCSDDFLIIVAISKDDYKVFKLNELLPAGFGKESL